MGSEATKQRRIARQEWREKLNQKAFWIVIGYIALCVFLAWAISAIVSFSYNENSAWASFWTCLVIVGILLELIFRNMCAYYRSVSMRLYLYDINARLADLGMEMTSMEEMSDVDVGDDIDGSGDVLE